jgi:hypothetical protein
MEAVREVTVWEGVSRQPNHDYLLDGDRVLAYRKWGQGEVITLSGKIKIDRRGRKFEKLKNNPFAAVLQALREEPVVIEVRGSKGDSYFVNPEDRTCTCQGFRFRGGCRHVVDILAQ